MSSFSTTERLAAKLKKPKEVYSYSITDGKVTMDQSQLKYYYLPEETILKAPIDLTKGIENWTQPNEHDTHLDTLLESLSKYERETGSKIDAEIITWRGILTKIMTHPYDQYNEPIVLNITYFDGHYFIEEDWQSKQQGKKAPDEQMKKHIYSGYKFESVALLNEPWFKSSREDIESRFDDIPNGDQFVSVVRTQIGDNKILIGGEVDCVFDPCAKGTSRYGELKTSREVHNAKDGEILERKMNRAWAQSFLLGVKHIIYGYRTGDHKLAAVDYFKTEDLPMYAGASSTWSGADEINFLNAALTKLKDLPKEDNKLWRLVFDSANKKVDITELDGESFLLKEFVDWRKSM
ncbi:YALIA101S03e15478g1_1 [Yarrowia lipolytica]|nr:Decapping nuclease RAI1 [Yarrowia lipolytica]SEI33321.1 YALIA101S03e15478g1_1 [Yarrowia lipolytica]